MNKIEQILAVLLFVPAMMLAQTPASNYVMTETVLSADGSNRVRSVQYHDGLGRPSVLASGGMNTSGKYVYTMTEYDIWGYPRRVYFSNYGMAEYVYSADGIRLKTRHVTAVPKSTPAPLNVAFKLSANEITSVDSTEYYGAYIYENGAFRQFNFGSGYIVPSGSAYAYKYYLKDHLGSNRVVVSSAGTIEQTTHYYPYGATLSCSTGQDVQPYKYNGKELDRMHRLDLYDYGARQYDPVIGQFTQIDPLCEKYYHISPYAYCANNPINFIDPDGREIWIYYVDKDGTSQSFKYYAGMTCSVDDSTAKTIVSNLNIMYSNQNGATVLDAIIGTPTKYGIRQSDTHSESGEGYFDSTTNIMYLYDANNTLTFAEEAFHIYQYVNNLGGKTDVNEVEAKLFSAKMNYEIDEWFNSNCGAFASKIAGNEDTPYPKAMQDLLYMGYKEELYKSAVDNFFDGSLGGPTYKALGYTKGKIKTTTLIKDFLPVKYFIK